MEEKKSTKTLISVRCDGFDDFRTEIFHITRLFFEDVELQYEVAAATPDSAPAPGGKVRTEQTVAIGTSDSSAQAGLIVRESAAYRLHLSVTEAPERGVMEAEAQLVQVQEGGAFTERHERRLPASGLADAVRRVTKRAVGYVLLRVLESATGVIQPWGTLTGVRPTKLVHNLLQEKTREETLQTLRDEYLITEPKAWLVTDIAERQLKVIPDLFHLDREVSVYLGIPFCPTKCAYCTFPAYDIRGQNGSVAAFLAGLHEEIRATGEWLRQAGLKLTTMYWGGGTPTSIEAHEMDALFESLHRWFPHMDELRELTVEAGRPDTITPDKIDVMKKWNVDRISINPQSFTQATLDSIGRHHTVKETIEKFKLAREMGMNNINMDLIIGLPDEGEVEFARTLEETAKLLPESLTVHTLSFKRASRMTKNRDQYEVAERDEIGEMMRMATDWTEAHGYVPYYMYRQKNMLGNLENVGYSLEGRESLYNIVMMEERQTIVGLGCGAVSKVLFPKERQADGNETQRIERFPNPKEPSVYNNAHREYTEKKLRLLDEAYTQSAGRT